MKNINNIKNINKNLPKHIAIIMDGNGRWAKQRFLPRFAGHKKGVETARIIITQCAKKKIPYLTLFALSSENWRRPETEINFLLDLFSQFLQKEIYELHENNIKLKFIGDISRFDHELQALIHNAETLTANNNGLQLNLAVNYGGQWDIVQAARVISAKVLAGELSLEAITEDSFRSYVSLADCPEPDLLIRTSGEYRMSNFLLLQCAYTELYFTDIHWPDFREAQFEEALIAFAGRKRRFGFTDEQVNEEKVEEAVGSTEAPTLVSYA